MEDDLSVIVVYKLIGQLKPSSWKFMILSSLLNSSVNQGWKFLTKKLVVENKRVWCRKIKDTVKFRNDTICNIRHILMRNCLCSIRTQYVQKPRVGLEFIQCRVCFRKCAEIKKKVMYGFFGSVRMICEHYLSKLFWKLCLTFGKMKEIHPVYSYMTYDLEQIHPQP